MTDLTFYLCGKIEHTDWRHSIVSGLRNFDSECNDIDIRSWLGMPIYRDAIGAGLHYSGPFFIGCDHGCFHGANRHGALEGVCVDRSYMPIRRQEISEAAYIQIRRADILFAWIDDLTCYGSLVEIGMARAFGKRVWIGFSPKLNRADLWFAESLADRSQSIQIQAYMGDQGWIRYRFICDCSTCSIPFNRWDLMLLLTAREI